MSVDIVEMLFYVSPFWSPSDETAPHCDKIEYDRLQRTSSAFVPLTSCHFSSTILLNLKINVHRVKWPRTRCCWTAVRDVPVGKGRYSYQTPASLVGRMVYWAIQAGLLTPLTCPASFKSLGCFYFRCVLSSQWTVNLRILHCQL